LFMSLCRISGGGSVVLVMRPPEAVAAVDLAQMRSFFGHRQLERVLRVDVRHNERRPHRALRLHAPDPPLTMPSTQGDPAASATAIRRRDLLGGLIHQVPVRYDIRAAAADREARGPDEGEGEALPFLESTAAVGTELAAS
jgi:hypothetical protein